MHRKNSKLSDQIEAAALGFRNNFTDIYSNSWGPGDMGWHVEGPGPLLAQVLENGTRLVSLINSTHKKPDFLVCICICTYVMFSG